MVDDESQEVKVDEWYKRLEESEQVMTNEFKPKYDLARKRLRSELDVRSQKRGRPVHNQVNLVYGIGVAFVNSVAFKMPEVNLTARNDEEREAVENTEIKINDFFRDVKVKATAKRGVWDAYLGGFHARYVDWEYSDRETGEPAVDETGMPITDEMGQPVMRRVVYKDRPVYKRIRPDLVRFPDGFDFDNYQDAPWIGFDLIEVAEDVKNNEQFDAEVRQKINGKPFNQLSEFAQRKNSNKASNDLYHATHYVFIRPKTDGDPFQLLVLSSEDKTKPLKSESFEKGQIGYPIKFLYFNPLDDDCFYPSGDPWIWESQLHAIDGYWDRISRSVRRNQPKIGYDKRDVPRDTVTAMKSNEGLEYVGVEPKSGQLAANVFFPINYPPAHPDNERFLEYTENILNRVAPKSALSQGDKQNKVDTATEAQIIQAGEMVDLDARMDDVKEYFIDLARDLAGLYTNNLVGETSVRGKNQNGEDISRTVGKEGFTTNIEIDIDVESMKPKNREIYRRQLLDMLITLKELEPMLMKKQRPKQIDPEFFIPKIVDNFGIRNAENALIDAAIRNPNKEHEQAAFGGIPLQVQEGEDLEGHLMEHMALINDPVRLQSYESVMPGFSEALQNHALETNEALKRQKQPTSQKKAPVAGTRQPQGTEIARANQV